MEKSKPAWLRVSGYFGVLFVFWCFSLWIWLQWGYEGSFLRLNQYHWPWLDQASLYFLTHLADGVILPGILLWVIWRKDPALAITAVLAVLITGLLAQTGKWTLFSEWYRPPRVFEGRTDVEIVMPGAPKGHSFPSGHATSFATGGFFLAYFASSSRLIWGILIGVLTVFLCYTRVTLGVHFPADIFIGSVLGSIGSFFILKLIYPPFQRLVGRKVHAKWMKATPYVLGFISVAAIAQFIHLISRIG